MLYNQIIKEREENNMEELRYGVMTAGGLESSGHRFLKDAEYFCRMRASDRKEDAYVYDRETDKVVYTYEYNEEEE